MSILDTLFFINAFIALWLSASLIITSIDKIAKKLKLSSFAISFFILGILTSIPEIAISITALVEKDPDIYVGTFLGGTIVIFLFIIPILAILGKGIRINYDLSNRKIILSLVVIALPALFIVDHRLTRLEGVLLIISYIILFFFIQKKHGIIDKILEPEPEEVLVSRTYSLMDMAKVALGIITVFIASYYIVRQTEIFSASFGIPTFYTSLFILAIGANLPELSIAASAIIKGKKDVAFGDYLGSAAANTLLFGVFTVLNDGEIFTINSFFITFSFIVLGLCAFYYFSRSRRDISAVEGVILLGIYILFIYHEFIGGV